jgi:hypothetical protein
MIKVTAVFFALLFLNGCAAAVDDEGGAGQVSQALEGEIGPISEENEAIVHSYGSCSGSDLGITYVKCTGSYCDNNFFFCSRLRYSDGSLMTGITQDWNAMDGHYETAYFSEEGAAEGHCGPPSNQNKFDGLVTGMRASGKYSDNIALECTRLANPNFFDNKPCDWTAPLSEEQGGMLRFPEGYVAVGARCSGKYCDNVSWHICKYN